MKHKILIIEDESHIASLLHRAFQEADYDAYIALDGKMGATLFDRLRPHLVVTDLVMPEMDGHELCRHIRASKSTVPILMLTAIGGTDDVVRGLDSGADDYLVKPFRLPELLARVRALLRRAAQAESDRVSKMADLTLDHETKEVRRNGELLKLTATEFRLLEFLLRNKGRLKTRMEILEEVWGVHFDPNTNVVDVYINYLRNKVDKPFEKKLIHTQVGLGFILKE
ncbi:MAG: response regulator transcription factor [Saprospiraceae bacterium]|nr:response regulator transcription factor [Saprospiraceae bacterium]